MRRVALVAWVCSGVLVGLSACSSDGSGDGTATGDASTSPHDAEATSTEPAGTEPAGTGPDTTEPGTSLAFGDVATVEWHPSTELAGVLELSVDAVREGDMDDFEGLVASGTVEGARPYYVDVTVSNAGDTDLGNRDVPLYLLDTSQALGPPWGFEEPFRPCRSRPLPEGFGAGDVAHTCLVFFARAGARFDAMAFQPSPDDAAITWDGRPSEPRQDRRGRPSRRRR